MICVTLSSSLCEGWFFSFEPRGKNATFSVPSFESFCLSAHDSALMALFGSVDILSSYFWATSQPQTAFEGVGSTCQSLRICS